MATNFGPEATNVSDIPSAQTPKEGVVTQPIFLEGLNDVFKQAGDMIIGKKKSQSQQIIADFTRRQLLVADAYAQGEIRSSAAAQSRMRKNLLDAIEANGGLTADLLEAQKAITGLPGGAKIVDERTDEENREKALTDKLVQEGLIDPDATPEEARQGVADFQALQEMGRRHQLRMQTLDEELKSQNVTSARRQEIKEEKKAESEKLARESAVPERRRLQKHMQQILDDPTLSEADKQVALDDLYAEFKSQATNLLSGLDSEDATVYLKPFDMMFESYQKRVTGELSDEELKRENERTLAFQTNLLLADPVFSGLAAASKLNVLEGFQQAIVANNPRVVDSFLKMFAGTTPGRGQPPSSPFTKDSVERQGLTNSLKIITEGLASSDPVIKQEATERMKIFMSSTELYEGLLRDNAITGQELVNWMASAEFYKAQSANPEAFQKLDTAKEIIGRYYSDEVWGMVQREFTDSKVLSVNSVAEWDSLNDADKVVGARSVASGVEFFALDPKDPHAVDKARQLNKELKPVINNTVKAMSHLEGHTNYQQTWEKNAAEFLGGNGVIQDNDISDDLSLIDFQQQLEKVENTGAPVGNVSDAGAGYTVVTLADGTSERRTGSRAWRNNNPGNIEYGSFARSQGAVGSDGRFAVFSSYEEGRKAKENLLFESSSYKNKTIYEAIQRYAPSFENDTEAYARTIARRAGVTIDTPLSELSQDQRQLLLDAMEDVEGFKVGKTELVK